MNSYCLICNGNLHFLPYSQDVYSSFLNNKTVSSLSLSLSSSDTPMTSTSSSPSPNPDDSQVSQLLNNYCTHAIYLPNDYIEPANSQQQTAQIKKMLLKIFPHWKPTDSLEIKRLTGGITNMLLQCTKLETQEKVLIRTYGRGTNLIIDRDREFVSQLVINSVGLAPPIHARFANGLVYGFISGRSLDYEEMSSPSLYPLIASKLGQWHSQIKLNLIQDSLSKLKQEYNTKATKATSSQDDIWSCINHWIQIVPQIEGITKVCNDNQDIHLYPSSSNSANPQTIKTILQNELDWMKFEIGNKSPSVASHSDLLSGNIIIPNDFIVSDTNTSPQTQTNPISFIDYEYMIKAPRAFDISNHFMEWQGFNCDKSLIPKPDKRNKVMRNWCAAYLGHDNTNSNTDADVDQLIDEIALYYGLPGFYWGIWAGIQSGISLIDFDYSGYSGERLVEYWNWKRWYLKNKCSINSSNSKI